MEESSIPRSHNYTVANTEPTANLTEWVERLRYASSQSNRHDALDWGAREENSFGELSTPQLADHCIYTACFNLTYNLFLRIHRDMVFIHLFFSVIAMGVWLMEIKGSGPIMFEGFAFLHKVSSKSTKHNQDIFSQTWKYPRNSKLHQYLSARSSLRTELQLLSSAPVGKMARTHLPHVFPKRFRQDLHMKPGIWWSFLDNLSKTAILFSFLSVCKDNGILQLLVTRG